jgi:hypothetical protein
MSQLGQSHRTNPWTDDFRSISVNRRSRGPLACHKRANTRLMHRALLGLFYHLVGAGKKGGRNVDAQGTRCRRIDHQIELRRLLNGQIAWLSTF